MTTTEVRLAYRPRFRPEAVVIAQDAASWAVLRRMVACVPYMFTLGAGLGFVLAETSLANVALPGPSRLLWHALTLGGSVIAAVGLMVVSRWIELAGITFLGTALAAYVWVLADAAIDSDVAAATATTLSIGALIAALGAGLMLRAGGLAERIAMARRQGQRIR